MGRKQKVEHKISYYKVRVSTGGVQTRWLGGSFIMVYRNNAGRLGSGFISVCLETHWLVRVGAFHVPERPCTPVVTMVCGSVRPFAARVCVCMCVCVCVCVCIYLPIL